MLQPIIDTLIPLLPGWLELPESYVGLLKSASHRYIKRVPKPGGGYRYFYHVGHGGGVHSEDHFVPGASFRFEGGHYHIKSAEGGKLVIEHDETKERKTVSKSELRDMLGAHHEPAIKAHREKVAGMLAEARANKASPKQIAKLEARARAVGVETQGKRKAPPSKPKEGATRDEHLAAHMAASDHHEFESDQLINEAQNREEDTGKRATALREKAKEHDRAFTAHRNALSALRHAKSDSDAATARSESEKAWAATHGLASQTGGGAKAAGDASNTSAKDEKDGRKPTHVGFRPGERNFEYVGRNDDGTIRVRNEGGNEFDLTKKESDTAHLSYAPSTSTQVQHIDPKKMSRTDYIRAEIGRLKASRAARVQDAEAAIADLVKVKLPVGIGPVQYLQAKTRPTKQESAALVSHRVAEKALKGDYNGDTYHFGRVWDMAHGKKDDHPGFSYGKD